MTILLTEKWCAVCMESTPHEKMLDGSLRCTLVDHNERAEWHQAKAMEIIERGKELKG